VVANAGIAGYAPIMTLEPSAWTDMIDVNLTGVFWTVKAALPHLLEGGRGDLFRIEAFGQQVAALLRPRAVGRQPRDHGRGGQGRGVRH